MAILVALPLVRAQEEAATPEPPLADEAPTVIEYPESKDNLRPLNKVIFAFNHQANRFLITPLSKSYNAVLPLPARKGIGNVFDTIGTPVSALNLALQGKGKKSRKQIERFGINLSIGLLGTLDPATNRFGIAKSDTGFDETLETYGFKRGSYLAIPFMGSSDCRAFIGSITDSILNPLSLLSSPESTHVKIGDAFQENAPLAPKYMDLYKETEDAYRFFRNLYEQGRLRDEDYPEKP